MGKIVQKVLSLFLMVAISFSATKFTCLAEQANVLTDVWESNSEIEELEATLIEGELDNSGAIPYTMLVDCIIGVSCDSDGMHIDISTAAVGIASVLGIKDIKVLKKTWYGGWSTVATSDGKEVNNQSTMGISLIYHSAEKDAKYKITCVHYGNVDGYTEGANDSGEFVFTY